MKKFVVTGGAGFIGSHITEHLLKSGHQVTVIDSLRTGFEKNLKGLNARFFEEDICNKKLVERIIKITNSKSEITFLEARPGDIKYSKADTSKFKQLGFKPQYTVDEALQETIVFYENELLI